MASASKRPNTKARVEFLKPKPASIQLLDRQLSSADPEVRRTGVKSIPEKQAPAEPLTDCLSAKLEHQNWYVRRTGSEAAVRAIESKGAAEKTVKDVLGRLLTHPDAETRRCAGNALVGIVAAASAPEPSKLIPPLVAEASAKEAAARLENEDPRVRQNALEALGGMGEFARPYMKSIAGHLADPDASVRLAVVRMCTSLGVVFTEAVEEVTAILQHQEPVCGRTAAKALCKLADHSGSKVAAAVARELPMVQDLTARRLVLMLMVDLGPVFAPHGKVLASQLDDQDFGIRVTAMKALVAAGPGVAASSLEHVQKRMMHPHCDNRRAGVDAMRALASMCPSYARAVGKGLQEEPEDVSAADALRYKCDIFRVLGGAKENAQPFLEDLCYGLEDKDWAVRRAAIEAFEDLEEHAEEAAPMVAKRLLHHDPDVRRAAAECLGRMGMHCGQYANRVEGMMETEEDEDVLRACQASYKMLQEGGAFQRGRAGPPGWG